MSQSATKLKAIRIVFGINFLGILFLCLIITADMFGFDQPVRYMTGSEFEIQGSEFEIQGSEFEIQGTVAPFVPRYGGNVTNANGTMYNVAFLKVHKAGSTTMQNLFFRLGLRHNLNILLPRKGNYMHSIGEAIPIKPPKTYNIFACHTTYRKTFFDQLIPTGSVKIGIVREPVDRMVSGAYYYRDVWSVPYLKKIPKANFIHNLINYPEKYDTSFYSRTRNSMGSDFGFPKNIKPSETDKINTYLKSLDSDFLLVLVVEKFDESLVMMKRYLSWSFLDIIYLKTNSHTHKPVVLNKEEQKKVRETNFLDYAIYEYFTKRFNEKLQEMTEDFNQEVKYFKSLLNDVFTFCSKNNIKDDSVLFVNETVWDKAFTVPGIECRWMNTKEIAFIRNIRTQAFATR